MVQIPEFLKEFNTFSWTELKIKEFCEEINGFWSRCLNSQRNSILSDAPELKINEFRKESHGFCSYSDWKGRFDFGVTRILTHLTLESSGMSARSPWALIPKSG